MCYVTSECNDCNIDILFKYKVGLSFMFTTSIYFIRVYPSYNVQLLTYFPVIKVDTITLYSYGYIVCDSLFNV